MDLKKNIEYVKEGLSSQEQFLSNLIKGEKFLKKYKVVIIAVLVLLLTYFSFNYIDKHSKEQDLKVSNEAYVKLLQNPDDKKALQSLKDSNINLYSLYIYHNTNEEELLKNILEDKKLAPVLSEFYTFELEGKSKDGFMQDYVNLIEGFKYLKEENYAKAKENFLKIPLSSDLFELANSYMHLSLSDEK